jgi:hypothetical protein
MTYTVIGFDIGDYGLPIVDLGLKIRQHGSTSSMTQKRDVVVLGVESLGEQPDDFKLLCTRFGEEFNRFALLNDVAVEAFAAINFQIKPLGEVDKSELRNRPDTLMTCPYWT